MPCVGDVYETTIAGASVILCVRVRDIRFMDSLSYDFLVLDGDEPTIRTWSSRNTYSFMRVSDSGYHDCSMEATMRGFKFKKIG